MIRISEEIGGKYFRIFDSMPSKRRSMSPIKICGRPRLSIPSLALYSATTARPIFPQSTPVRAQHETEYQTICQRVSPPMELLTPTFKFHSNCPTKSMSADQCVGLFDPTSHNHKPSTPPWRL